MKIIGGMKNIIGVLGLILTSATGHAATPPPSLFLTPEEQQAPSAQAQTRTTLDALIYYSPNQWKIWLNGQAFTPDTPTATTIATLTVESVTATTVTLRQQLGTKTAHFTLAPHQSYDWSNDQITAAP